MGLDSKKNSNVCQTPILAKSLPASSVKGEAGELGGVVVDLGNLSVSPYAPRLLAISSRPVNGCVGTRGRSSFKPPGAVWLCGWVEQQAIQQPLGK